MRASACAGWLFLFSVLLFSCNNKGKKATGEAESPTRGTISISVDESLKPVVEQELKVFDSSFPNAHIHESYLTEGECFDRFFKDSVRLIVVTRDLTPSEKALCTQNGIVTKSLPIAMDAIALIVHPGSPDSLMTLGQLKAVLSGTFARPYTVVFDNEKSGTVRYILDSLIPGQKLPSNLFAVQHNEAVIDYVAQHEQALGILGVTHVYDPADGSGAGIFRKGIQVVALRDDSTGDFYQPYQAYIALKQYPLTRPVYFISRENWQGPATGFANFLCGERGQLLFNKARLVPLRVPLTIREAELK